VSQDLDVRGEEKGLLAAKWQKLSRSIAAAWAAEGYLRRAHLQHVTGSGDAGVLHDFWRRERESLDGGSRNFACYLSVLDMHDVAEAIQAGRR
jgi:hypothetical protein